MPGRMLKNFQDIKELGDIREASATELAEAISDNPPLRHVVRVARDAHPEAGQGSLQAVGLERDLDAGAVVVATTTTTCFYLSRAHV